MRPAILILTLLLASCAAKEKLTYKSRFFSHQTVMFDSARQQYISNLQLGLMPPTVKVVSYQRDRKTVKFDCEIVSRFEGFFILNDGEVPTMKNAIITYHKKENIYSFIRDTVIDNYTVFMCRKSMYNDLSCYEITDTIKCSSNSFSLSLKKKRSKNDYILIIPEHIKTNSAVFYPAIVNF